MLTRAPRQIFWFFIFLLPLLTSCESRKTIVNGLEEKDANEIVVYLSNQNVDVYKVPSAEAKGGGGQKMQLYDISVSAEQATEAMGMLNRAGLPRRRSQSLLNIFSNVGLVPSEMEQKVRYQAGLAEQIASTIRKIDGVLDAEVQISFPEEDPLNPGKTKGEITSSVYVKHNGVLDDPNSHLVSKIKRLVAASVTGLKYDNVTVIGDRARFEQSSAVYGGGEKEQELVSIWHIVIAKDSMSRFRFVFFSLFIVILLLILAVIWVGWKVYPILKKEGGVGALFHLKPIVDAKPAEEEKKGEEEEGAKEEEKDKEEKGPPTEVT